MGKKQRIEILQAELARLEIKRQDLISQIAYLENDNTPTDTHTTGVNVTHLSPVSDKVRLFRSLFHGRQDVYSRRFESQRTGKSGYQPVCKNEWIAGICRKKRVKSGDCPARDYIPVTNQVIEWHLRGKDPSEYPVKEFVVGVYPMLLDETCWFLAADFDKSSWEEDITAFKQTCNRERQKQHYKKAQKPNAFEPKIHRAVDRYLDG